MDVETPFARMKLMMSDAAMDRLYGAHVAIFGIGGVGGHTAEALARSGVGELTLVDFDTVSLSNLNRQIIALHSTLGAYKADVMRARILDINPNAIVHSKVMRYCEQTRDELFAPRYDFVVDAIDTVTHKLDLICTAHARQIPIISAMGAGNKFDPTAFTVTDLAKTHDCPLARVMRKELRSRGIEHHPVVFSPEPPQTPRPLSNAVSEGRRSVPGSVAWVPGCAGMILAGEVVRWLTVDTDDK